MANTPIEALNQYVRGVHYPARRETVIEDARRNGAPPEVIERLHSLLPRVAGPHEVLIALRGAPTEKSYLSPNRFRSGPGLGRVTGASG